MVPVDTLAPTVFFLTRSPQGSRSDSKHWFTTSFLRNKVPESDARSVGHAKNHVQLSAASRLIRVELFRCHALVVDKETSASWHHHSSGAV